MNRVACVIVAICLFPACARNHQRAAKATPSPSPSPTVSAAGAKLALESPAALTRALERRWPLTAIRTFCILERQHDDRSQNLVAYSQWKGVLYPSIATGFDKISWYASTKDGRAEQYSLGVNRGTDFWLLEIGDENTLQAPPEYSPDPNRPGFVGHK
jgi:hypothetical protein